MNNPEKLSRLHRPPSLSPEQARLHLRSLVDAEIAGEQDVEIRFAAVLAVIDFYPEIAAEYDRLHHEAAAREVLSAQAEAPPAPQAPLLLPVRKPPYQVGGATIIELGLAKLERLLVRLPILSPRQIAVAHMADQEIEYLNATVRTAAGPVALHARLRPQGNDHWTLAVSMSPSTGMLEVAAWLGAQPLLAFDVRGDDTLFGPLAGVPTEEISLSGMLRPE